MTPENKEAWVGLLKAWNQVLELEIGRTMGSRPDAPLSPDMEFAVRNSVMNSLYGWEESYQTADGIKSTDLLAEIDDLPAAVELFELAALYCSQELPEFIAFKLGCFGTDFVSYLLGLVAELDLAVIPHDGAGNEKELMALNLLGQWQAPGVSAKFLEEFSALKEPALPLVNILYNFACYDLMTFKAELIQRLEVSLKAVDSGQMDFTAGLSYQMYILADISVNDKEDAVYELLRSSYRAMPDKIMGSLALVQYGDRRAVSVLRHSLLDRSGQVQKQNRALYSQVLAAIRELGGQVDDLL